MAGAVLDGLVSKLVLQALEPAALELSIKVAEDLEAEREQLHRHWAHRLERANYAADRAFRQYNAVEPENRLVARTLERPSNRTWQRDANLGANTLTIANGHVIDALRFVVGNFARVACMVTTQVQQWYETDTQQLAEVTSPDNVRVCGQLESGASASVHVGAVPWAGSGFRMEIYGREGTLVTTGSVSSQRGEMLRVQGAKGSHELRDLAIPERFVYVPADFPRGDPFNVGQMYALFAKAIRTGQSRLPTFDIAADLHRFLDTIKQASDTGRELRVV